MRHALQVAAAFALFFLWVYGSPIVEGSLLAESDMYEQFMPVFLAPMTTWSSYEFGGMAAFADPQDTAYYPLTLLFRLAGSWNGFVIAAFVLASCFTYAYVFSLTRSRMAAAFAGLAFGLSEAMMERLAHVTTIHAVAWLPLLLLAIDRLRTDPVRAGRSTLWVAIGGAAIAACILGGHPQIVLYIMYACGLYALAGGLCARAGGRYYGRLGAAFVIGLGLTAIKAIPLAETTALTARQALGFDAFVSHANTPAQMLSALFPVILHEGREAPTYVGLATLVFALVALRRPRQDWRVVFWLAAATVAFFIGMGDATPAARVAYDVPLYDRFRVSARHLILTSFGLVTLAGFGLAALQRGEASRRAVSAAAAAVAVALAAAAAALARWPAAFEFDNEPGLTWGLPIWNGAVWLQFILCAATVVACVALARRPRSRVWTPILFGVLATDLLVALPYGVELTGVDATRIPGSAIRPSTHAVRLAEGMAPAQQRLLAPEGTQLDAVVPAAFARVWRIPIAGGYGPMLLARHGALAMMGTNGSVDPLVMADDNAALDVLAVRYVVRQADGGSPETFEQDGVTWARNPLDLPVGPDECGQRYPRSLAYALPADVQVASVAIVARLRCSEDVPQGTQVAIVRLAGADGARVERPLAAGVDIADAGLSDPGVAQRARHREARTFERPDGSHGSLIRVDLPAPMAAPRLEIDVSTAGWMEIGYVSVIDASGRSIPQQAPAILLDPARWRETGRFATSRVTDRGADEESPDEQTYVVYENLRARPRAWLAREVIPLADDGMLDAVHHSRLPDGRRFDPASMALVEPGTPAPAADPGRASSPVVRQNTDGTFAVEVATEHGGFLVLSESAYPGWRARIGDTTLPVHRTNVSLQGVLVPPGHHVVAFEFVPRTLRAGAAVSALALIVLVGLAWTVVRRKAGYFSHARI